ncbi:hypothetical protein ACFU96_45800 [Streptomyces sp. NPDC057620]
MISRGVRVLYLVTGLRAIVVVHVMREPITPGQAVSGDWMSR